MLEGTLSFADDNRDAGMNSFRNTHHRWSLALTAALATVIAVLLVVLGTAEGAPTRGQPIGDGDGGVTLVQVGGQDFNAPVNVAFAPGRPNKVYVVEQGGRVKVIVGGNARAKPFLDATDVTNANGEGGLLGLAFHPNFKRNGRAYTYFTDAANGDIVISEYKTRSAVNAREASRRTVIRIRHRDAANHNGGQVLFGPDGHMYLATGDGGGANDPRENAQDKKSLLGKVLRINPRKSGSRPYSIPARNPFVGRPGKNEIFARGLRNPFRFGFDPENGRIAIGDVGQSAFEEVNYETRRSLRGANFGWDRWEGLELANGSGDNEAQTPTAENHDGPIHVYQQPSPRAITGGVVVRDPDLTSLYGRYVFTDFFEGQLRSLVPRLGGAIDEHQVGVELAHATSFGSDPATGDVYATSRDGQLFRLDPLP